MRRRVAQVDGSIMAGIVLGMSNKRSIIGVLSLRKTTLYAMRSEIIVELRVLGPAKFFSLGFTWKEPLKRFRGGYKKSLLFPLDGSHSSLCTCLRTTAEFVRWNAYNNARPPLFSFFFSFHGFFNVRG